MTGEVLAEGNNFLIPNGTFIVELIIFVIVLVVVWRLILPPVQKAMHERQEMLERQHDESRQAEERFEAAKKKYAEELAEARAESNRIRDEARVEGQKILDEHRDLAQAEMSEVLRRGEEQLAQQRERVVTELRGSVPDLSTTLASRIVGRELGSASEHQETVSRFLAELGPAGKGE